MPRFFFNIHSDDYDATDLVGDHCRDTRHARAEACRTARDLVRETLALGRLPDGWIEVEDEEHRPVLVVPFAAVAS
jgi:hypothetical protein